MAGPRTPKSHAEPKSSKPVQAQRHAADQHVDAGSAETQPEYRTLSEIIASKLRRNIYDGSIFDTEYGPGARLNISDLAKRLKVSPIPVREALRRLEAEGLIDFHPNRGAVVRTLSASELHELFLIRIPLETLAATEAALSGDTGSFAQLKPILEEMDATVQAELWRNLHERFHQQLNKLSNLPRLAELVTGLRGQMRPYAHLYTDDPSQIRHVQVEHYAILKALRTRNIEQVKSIIYEHLARPARIALAKLGATPEMLERFQTHG